MKVKIGLARAYKVAKANGYDGPEEIEAVRKWFNENTVRGENGEEIEVVAKTVTISVKADAGESVVVSDDSQAGGEEQGGEAQGDMPMEPKAITAAELKKLREAKRELEGIKGIAASGVNGVLARIHQETSARNHANIAGRKAYEKKAARGETKWDTVDEAEAFGAWTRLQVFGWREYEGKAFDQDIVRKTGVTTTFTSTGALVPPQFVQRLIDIRRSYGVVEGLFYNQPMTGDTAQTPRRTGSLTVYTPGEAGAITASDFTTDQVGLTARKRACLSKVSSESMNDSAFSVGDILANEIAWAFAKDDDARGLNGDGTSTYAGDVGIRQKLLTLSATRANIAGLVVGADNIFSGLTLANFESVCGRLPSLQGATGTPQWLVHSRFYWEVMARLALASGGVTAGEVEGVRRQMFLGYPVVFAEQMPRTEANDIVCALFGWFNMAATFGRTRTMEIATSEHSDFANDLIAVRGTQRTAISVHDVGNADATEANREPGPVVGLATAAS